MITSEEIKRRLWNGATELRGSMDASRYKDYMLGLMFYKFLSDKTLETFRMTAGVETVTEKELVEQEEMIDGTVTVGCGEFASVQILADLFS